jgi:nucleotide-binding universal stress UspA family protein
MEEKMVPQIKKILYATDLSKNSSYAFYYAVDLAKKNDARIVILHAVEPVPPYAALYGDVTYQMEQDWQQEATENVKKLLQNFCQKVEGELGPPCAVLVSSVIVKVGHPIEEILNAADTEGCDLIVLGNHGKGFLKQTFLGSVSRRVLDRARKPVFIVPLPPEKSGVDWDGL